MLKLCGAVLVLVAAACLGIGVSWRLQRRVDLLQRLLNSFLELRTEIVFMQSPLPEAVAQVSARTGDRVFGAFAARLRADMIPVDAMCAALAREEILDKSDKRILVCAAQALGNGDIQAQACHLENVQRQIQAQLEQAKTIVQTKGKLYMMSGVLGGALIVILLL